MEKILDYVKWLVSLPEKHKPFALSLLAIGGLIFALKVQTDKLELSEGRERVLYQQATAAQQQAAQQAINFKEEKYIAVIKEKENCEIEKQNIHKKYADHASKINKSFNKKR